MFTVNYKGQYKSPEFKTFEEAMDYCKLQAPNVPGFKYSYFSIENDEYEWSITFRKPCEMIYKRCEKKAKPAPNGQPLPIILHYGGSDQEFFGANQREEAIERIKVMAPKMVGGFVILKNGTNMWKTSYDGKTLHHQPCKLINGEYIDIVA